jgi:hypothetical protein
MKSTDDKRLIDANEFKSYLENSAKLEKKRGTVDYVHNAISWAARQIDYAPTVKSIPRTSNCNKRYAPCDEFLCRRCGLHLEDWRRFIFDPETGEPELYEYEFKYCPECGAAIMESE